ncbi:hypothetical protein [Synechococcus sp. PCC 6312]|uniref:hypothetical protein n=1 Tax=Synechococcus sp. (strain ATCC 27167 / PCC 6312) TaxID=195253 RepID=UPI00029ED0F2|nr:hypothetical protein [Synechococcus sp. PCC 6312]AFY62086.1 hypothetical protein Syn6312_3032 [Synechococcus sp. PCC 6312]
MTTDREGFTVVRLSTATVAAICAGLAGVGGGFLAFYNTICVPQVSYLQADKSELAKSLGSLGDAIRLNTEATNKLIAELKR